jgi:hypothetical protein
MTHTVTLLATLHCTLFLSLGLSVNLSHPFPFHIKVAKYISNLCCHTKDVNSIVFDKTYPCPTQIIRNMVQEDERKMDALTRRATELTMVNNNSKLLHEMLDHYDKVSTWQTVFFFT